MFHADEVQKHLKTLSYWQGPVNGDLRDAHFRAALRRFQHDNGLAADGWYGAKTEAKLSPLVVALEEAPPGTKRLCRFRLTWYHISEEGSKTGKVPVYAQDGTVLARVTPDFFADMSLEGTGRLRDGRLLNVTGKYRRVKHDEYADVLAVAKRNKWVPDKVGYAGISLDDSLTEVDAALTFHEIPASKRGLGYGSQKGMPMTPFKTLATDIGAYRTSDPQFRGKGGLVPVKSRIWIANFVGRKLPDGSTHDGWCVAGDTGGAIYGAHFDVFTGTASLKRQFDVPPIGYVWYETPKGDTSEQRIPATYAYGV